LPEHADIADTVRVIDVPAATGGKVLRVLMNADEDKALGYLVDPKVSPASHWPSKDSDKKPSGNHWAWRLEMAEKIASKLDPKRFGVQAMYVIGSTKNATAGPESDIDFLIHFRGTKKQRLDLMMWMEGWSLSLDEMNFQKTGLKTGGILDVHLITDKDIANKTSYAVKIDAVTDAARPLRLKSDSPAG